MVKEASQSRSPIDGSSFSVNIMHLCPWISGMESSKIYFLRTGIESAGDLKQRGKGGGTKGTLSRAEHLPRVTKVHIYGQW